jgi:predicted nucleotidyltransferase
MADTAAMDRIVTLTERKADEAARRQRAVADLRHALDAYASTHGGRYLLFGSAASGTMRHDSDVDILVDFPPDRQVAAWNFVERACWDRRLSPDIMASAWCTEDFLALVRPKADVLGSRLLEAEVPGE